MTPRLPLSTLSIAILPMLRGLNLTLSCDGTDHWRALWADDCLIVWPRPGRAHNSMPWIYGLDDPSDPDHEALLEWLGKFSLDVNDEQVIAHLLRLCARALGAPGGTAFLVVTGEPEHGFVALRTEWGLVSGRRWVWDRGTGSELSEWPSGVALPARCDESAALTALTLALAPKIAALRGAR